MAKALSSPSRSSCSARSRGWRLSRSYPRASVTSGRERDGQQPGPAADRPGAGPQQFAERDAARARPRCTAPRTAAGHWAAASTAPATSATCTGWCRQRPPPGHRQHGRPRQQPQQPGQVPVAGVAVDHRRPQDRPVQAGAADLLLRGQPDLLGRRVQGRRHRGGGDEHGPLDPGLLGGGHDGRAVPEAQRGQADQDVAVARRGERLVQAGRVAEVPGDRPRAPGRHRARGGRARGPAPAPGGPRGPPR